MKLANLATAAVFAAFLAAPVGSLALFGPHVWAEKVVTAEELAATPLILPDDTYRNDVARRLVTNSPVGMNAIGTRNSLDFKVFGFVNTSQVISGEDGWLFYKPGFQKGECLSDSDIGVILGRIEALRAIAGGAGIDFRMSVSPDKEVVYPEKLGPAAEAAAGCKILSSRKWRRVAEAGGSSVIDHFKVMGHDFTDDLLYYKTDTHWNDLGKTKAMGQLVRELTGREVSNDLVPNEIVQHITDSPRNLLRFFFKEERKVYSDYVEANFPAVSVNKIPNTIIIHDSFYGVSADLIDRIFLNPTRITYALPGMENLLAGLLENRPLVLANTVERYLKQRLWGDLSWNGGVGRAFIDANAKAARDCPVSDVASDDLTRENLKELSAGDFAAGVDPQIYVKLPDGGRPCVRISFETTVKQPTFVHLPIRSPANQNGPYFQGFSVTLAGAPGPREFWIVLPEEFAGTTLRIDPIAANGPVSKLKIESGFLPPIETSLAN